MNDELTIMLSKITKEERSILKGEKTINKSIYTDKTDFIIDSQKMIEKGKLIDIRTHTRFTYFPKHKHNFVEIMYMWKGESTHIINDTTKITLKAGDLLFLNQHTFHEVLPTNEKDICINFIILPQFFDITFGIIKEENIIYDFIISSLSKSNYNSHFIHFEVSKVLVVKNLIENLVWSIKKDKYADHMLNKITMSLLFLHLSKYTHTMSKQNDFQNIILINTLKYIDENYKDATLTKLSEDLKVPISKLCRLIKSNTDITFKDLLQRKRLSKAAELLKNTNLPISDIIFNIGYENTSYFHKIFREKYLSTPKQYRDR